MARIDELTNFAATRRVGKPALRLGSHDCEVAVIGAGPYGLATAAHLIAAGIDTQVFGEAMSFWRHHMPQGMTLRSKMSASYIADPARSFGLPAYLQETGISRNDPLPLEDFVNYGLWFQRRAVPNLDSRQVVSVEGAEHGFQLTFDDARTIKARRVVFATGLGKQDDWPAPFVGLPRSLVSHSCEHPDLSVFRGRRVAVIGRGQSAIGSAALLNCAGANVELICRGDIRWFGSRPDDDESSKGLRARLGKTLAAPSGVGPFPLNWLVEMQGVVHLLPPSLRNWVSMRSLRPGSSAWLMPQFEGVQVRAGRHVVAAAPSGDKVALRLDQGSGEYDHVMLATGYRIDISRLGILSTDLLKQVSVFDGAPILANGFQSSVPGLHFVGGSAVWSYGPLMRFVCGAGYAARAVTRSALAERSGHAAAEQRPIYPVSTGWRQA
jgi:cation diffusion facilitator CzcD-associated flavoprotein CzcO